MISPGSNEISRANFNLRYKGDNVSFITDKCEVKLDSYGSVSLAHPKYLTKIKSCKEYGIPIVSLNGIGGKTLPITKAGILSHVKRGGKLIKFLCYAFNTPVGNTKEIFDRINNSVYRFYIVV